MVFISYKSVDANIVRRVVDSLISYGVKPWFAEYEVIVKNYDDFEEQLELNISKAIKHCDYAIIFTNHLWYSSKHCIKERREIFNEIPKRNILQINLPREISPPLSIQKSPEIKTVDYEGDLHGIISFVCQHVPCKGKPERDEFLHPDDRPMYFRTRYGTLNTGYLEMGPPNLKLGTVGQQHEYRFGGTIKDVFIRFEINVNPYDSLVKHKALESANRLPGDDWEIYRLLRKRADAWYGKHNLKEMGLHLVQWGGASHLGLTYLTEYPDGVHYWHRIYSLLINDNISGRVVTVVFDFATVHKFIDSRLSFPFFCGMTHYLDFILDSFTYQTDTCLLLMRAKETSAVKQRVFMSLGVVLAAVYYFMQRPDDINYWVLLGCLAGGTIGGYVLGKIVAYIQLIPYINCLRTNPIVGPVPGENNPNFQAGGPDK